MTRDEAISRMVMPRDRRPRKPRGGVIQIWVTRNCDKACTNCTQGSNFRTGSGDYPRYITPDQFETACLSLQEYFGVVGVFGGNPATHPQFETLCEILRATIPPTRRGLWCNNPINQSKGLAMARTFNPAVSNLNVHLDQEAYNRFRSWWPSSKPFGLTQDSRHAPVYASPIDLGIPEEEIWGNVAECDINRYWSAMIGVFRGELRGYFCEIAGAMSMLKQVYPLWPDTGVKIEPGWWGRPAADFSDQIETHCRHCAVPLRGYGELAQSESGTSTVTDYWRDVSDPKPKTGVQVVSNRDQLREKSLNKMTNYLGNSSK